MYEIKSYPDGGKYVVWTQQVESITYRINSYEDLFLLKSLKDANPLLKEVIIPCMFQQQHDRRFNHNESFELKLVCDFINSCRFEKVKVYHPHSDVTAALLNNFEAVDNEGFIREVLGEIVGEKRYDYDSRSLEEDLILMSSDAGGFKPLIKLCKQLDWEGETFSASKARERDKLIQVIDKQDFNGKDILLIDDICVYGGTFVGLAKLLKERGAGNLYLAISHLTVEEPNPILFDLFEKIFVTNSKGIEYKVPNKEKLIIFDFFKI